MEGVSSLVCIDATTCSRRSCRPGPKGELAGRGTDTGLQLAAQIFKLSVYQKHELPAAFAKLGRAYDSLYVSAERNDGLQLRTQRLLMEPGQPSHPQGPPLHMSVRGPDTSCRASVGICPSLCPYRSSALCGQTHTDTHTAPGHASGLQGDRGGKPGWKGHLSGVGGREARAMGGEGRIVYLLISVCSDLGGAGNPASSLLSQKWALLWKSEVSLGVPGPQWSPWPLDCSRSIPGFSTSHALTAAS